MKFSWSWLSNPLTEATFRWSLGGLFVLASLPKLMDPMAFARIIDGYGLLWDPLIDPLAYILPWVELSLGISLIVGFLPRWNLHLLNLLMVVFILAISANMLRGHEFHCGCTSLDTNGPPSSPLWLLTRDLICLGMGLHCLAFQRRLFCLWAPGEKQDSESNHFSID